MSTTSMVWWLSRARCSRPDWPVMATRGALSRFASATPVREVGGPGPQRRQADTGVARQPAVDVGHERCALFVAHRNERHVGVPQREQQFLEFLAGEAEDVVDALDFETRREEVGGRHLTRPLDVVGDFRAGPTGSRGRRTP